MSLMANSSLKLSQQPIHDDVKPSRDQTSSALMLMLLQISGRSLVCLSSFDPAMLSGADHLCGLQLQSKLMAAKRRLQLVQSTALPGVQLSSSRVIASVSHADERTAGSIGPSPHSDDKSRSHHLAGQDHNKPLLGVGLPSSTSARSLPKPIDVSMSTAEADDPSDLCVVCFERQPEIEFLPCRHAVTCKACAHKIVNKSNECPMCRASLTASVPI